MARYTGPKIRLARREGMDLEVKTPGSKAHAVLLKRLMVPPGQHGQKGRRKVSNYAMQLREKQKAKRYYGVLEKQFQRYYHEAKKRVGNTGEALLQRLETRLDNIVYRLQFAPTRAAARQQVTHGHVLVNNERLTIPSHQVKPDDTITLNNKGMNVSSTKKILEEKNPLIPAWLERKAVVGRLIKAPERSDMNLDINEQLIVEFYSR